MKSKTTGIWLVLAVLLAAAIWVLQNYFQPEPPGEKLLFDGLNPDRVACLQIIPSGTHEINVVRTNRNWLLQKPFIYPAQATKIESLLDALKKLTPTAQLSPADMSRRKDADAEFGFDNPQFTLDLADDDQIWHVKIGNKTAPGDGVYVRMVGTAGAYVTDPAWLQLLPRDAGTWRDTTLADVPALADWIVITNGTRAIELRREVTNHLWRITRPQSARADSFRIVMALEQLRTAKVSQFVNDAPADLNAYGLAPAALDVWLGSGTNMLSAVHVGKDATNGMVFARREGLNLVVATAKEPLSPWRGAWNDFRDPNLLELTAPVAEIEVRGENGFTLQQRSSNVWAVAGEKFPVNGERVEWFIKTLSNLRIADFVKDVVPGSGLQKYGLDNPTRQVTLRSAVGNTNSVIVQLLFGSSTTNEVFVKRSDEESVYGIPLQDFASMLLPGDFYRDPHIWSFSTASVAQVTVRQDGKTRQLLHTGTNAWSLIAGTGIIDPLEVEETVRQLSNLNAQFWIGRNFTDADIGRTTNSLSLTIELKSGEKYAVDFGKPANRETLFAAVTLDGERWAFFFPPTVCALVAQYLTIPADDSHQNSP